MAAFVSCIKKQIITSTNAQVLDQTTIGQTISCRMGPSYVSSAFCPMHVGFMLIVNDGNVGFMGLATSVTTCLGCVKTSNPVLSPV